MGQRGVGETVSAKRAGLTAVSGVRGPIAVDGRTFIGAVEMSAMANVLDDTAIAEILTYIRHEWGHHADPVASANVPEVRAELSKIKRTEAWTVKELKRVKYPKSDMESLVHDVWRFRWSPCCADSCKSKLSTNTFFLRGRAENPMRKPAPTPDVVQIGASSIA